MSAIKAISIFSPIGCFFLFYSSGSTGRFGQASFRGPEKPFGGIEHQWHTCGASPADTEIDPAHRGFHAIMLAAYPARRMEHKHGARCDA
jgi:hypothetical protein